MSGQTRWRAFWSSEDGIGLVEVMVTAVITVIVATTTAVSITESQKTSGRTLARGITANLAEQDQERMRSMRASDLANYSATRTITQQTATYRVDSTAEFVNDANGDAVSCTSTGSQASYLRLTSTVTPQATTGAPPRTVKSIMALPISQYSPTSGTLIVPLSTDAGLPTSGVTVALTGPESRTATTNSKGCAVFQFLTPGAYTITLNQNGYVGTGLAQKVTYSGTVSAGNINQATPTLYDRWGSLTASFDGGQTTTLAPGISIFHSGISVAPTTRTFNALAATPLFPFKTAYAVYSGTCASNDPTQYDSNYYSNHPTIGQALVTASTPAANTAVTLHEPTVRPSVLVKWYKNKADTTATDNVVPGGSATAPGGTAGTATVYFKAADSGCSALPGSPGPSLATQTDGTVPAANAQHLPYGKYNLCAQFTKTVAGGKGNGTTGPTGVYSAVQTGVADTAFAGTSQALKIDTTNTANAKACSAVTGW